MSTINSILPINLSSLNNASNINKDVAIGEILKNQFDKALKSSKITEKMAIDSLHNKNSDLHSLIDKLNIMDVNIQMMLNIHSRLINVAQDVMKIQM